MFRHGGIIFRAYQSRLKKVNAQDESQEAQLSISVSGKENGHTEPDVRENSADELSVHENIEADNNTGLEKDVTITESPTDVKLKTGENFTFTYTGDGIQYTARVLGRTGKAKGQYKN